jgi:hypothetical protein
VRQPLAHQARRSQEIEARALLQGAEAEAEGWAGRQGRDGKLSHAPSWIHGPPKQRAEAAETTRLWIPCQATPTDLEKQRGMAGMGEAGDVLTDFRSRQYFSPRLALFVH